MTMKKPKKDSVEPAGSEVEGYDAGKVVDFAGDDIGEAAANPAQEKETAGGDNRHPEDQ